MPESPLPRKKQRDTVSADETSAVETAETPAAPSRREQRKAARAEKALDRAAMRGRSKVTPRWWVVLMVGLMAVGLIWIVVFYLSSTQYPVPGWDNWNLVAGFGLVLVGFAMTTRWR